MTMTWQIMGILFSVGMTGLTGEQTRWFGFRAMDAVAQTETLHLPRLPAHGGSTSRWRPGGYEDPQPTTTRDEHEDVDLPVLENGCAVPCSSCCSFQLVAVFFQFFSQHQVNSMKFHEIPMVSVARHVLVHQWWSPPASRYALQRPQGLPPPGLPCGWAPVGGHIPGGRATAEATLRGAEGGEGGRRRWPWGAARIWVCLKIG